MIDNIIYIKKKLSEVKFCKVREQQYITSIKSCITCKAGLDSKKIDAYCKTTEINPDNHISRFLNV